MATQPEPDYREFLRTAQSYVRTSHIWILALTCYLIVMMTLGIAPLGCYISSAIAGIIWAVYLVVTWRKTALAIATLGVFGMMERELADKLRRSSDRWRIGTGGVFMFVQQVFCGIAFLPSDISFGESTVYRIQMLGVMFLSGFVLLFMLQRPIRRYCFLESS